MTESPSCTHKFTSPEGTLFITVARDPTVVNVHAGKQGTQASVIGDRLGAVCGMALRGGVPATKLIGCLLNTAHERSPRERGQNGHSSFSIPDAIGLALQMEFIT